MTTTATVARRAVLAALAWFTAGSATVIAWAIAKDAFADDRPEVDA